MSDFIADFLKGQSDCEKGIPHEAGKSSDYDRGYEAQYAMEQVRAELSKNEHH